MLSSKVESIVDVTCKYQTITLVIVLSVMWHAVFHYKLIKFLCKVHNFNDVLLYPLYFSKTVRLRWCCLRKKSEQNLYNQIHSSCLNIIQIDLCFKLYQTGKGANVVEILITD